MKHSFNQTSNYIFCTFDFLWRNKQSRFLLLFLTLSILHSPVYAQISASSLSSDISDEEITIVGNVDTLETTEKYPDFRTVPLPLDNNIKTEVDTIVKTNTESEDSISAKLLQIVLENEITPHELPLHKIIAQKSYEMLNDSSVQRALKDAAYQPLSAQDTATFYGNPFFIDLIYMGLPINTQWKLPNNFTTLYHGMSAVSLDEVQKAFINFTVTPKTLYDLRKDARKEITRTRFDLYESIFTKLPNPNKNKSTHITSKPLTKVLFVDEDFSSRTPKKLKVEKPVMEHWRKAANAMVQFSQNYVSNNWHQGGSGNMAVLTILTGRMNYDNKKNIQWENNGEWRAGIMNVDDTTALRRVNVNDDILKINSKFGLKAGGNWFYSSNLDFSTQLFDNYKAVNSKEYKTRFLTPVRMNLGVGMDYKYKKLFSVMFAPVAYKFVYANDTVKINPNAFGIETGKNSLHEIGSSFIAQCNYVPFRELQVNSKLKFYTNYEKVEIDWEIVSTFMVNRFLTTRISLNPRYDNTVILKDGEKAKIQFRELMSFGFSFRLH